MPSRRSKNEYLPLPSVPPTHSDRPTEQEGPIDRSTTPLSTPLLRQVSDPLSTIFKTSLIMVILTLALVWLGFALPFSSCGQSGNQMIDAPGQNHIFASSSTSTVNSTSSSNYSLTSAVPRPSPNPSTVYLSNQVPSPPSPLNASYHNYSPRWHKAHIKAAAYLSNWTIEEKVALTTGLGWEQGRCLGNIGEIPTRNFSGLCAMDSPLGIRLTDFNSAFPAGINVASTFDKDLMYARGYAMGQEFKGKGAHIHLGPMTNMYRVPAGGRAWEGFGGDPYLAGWATEMTVRGVQDAGVQACVKHFIGNEQERNRTTSTSQLDDRTFREIYSHPFLRAIQADVASVMCSYNLLNGSWACQNSEILNGVLKTDFGFQGYVMSDWNAQHSGVLSANSGMDMTMPGDIEQKSLTSYWGRNLTEAVKNGSVTENRLDDMTQRIMAAYFLLGQNEEYPPVSFDSARPRAEANNSHVDVRDDHWKLIQHIGASSTVLLKNVNQTLPLNKPRSISLIGSDLAPAIRGPNGIVDRGGVDGTLAMGWGSGTANFPYLVDPLQAISLQARHDGTTLEWWLNDFDTGSAAYWATGTEVAIVGINADSGEAYITYDGNEGDRNNLTAWHNGDELVKAVAGANNNTIVVVHSVGPITMEEWIDHPNVTAVLWAGLPGQESGNALVDVLYGAYNPSGRLPYTIAKSRDDYSADIEYVNSSSPEHPEVVYAEGLDIDYRWFLSKNITPRYEFGYGLSYTTFELSNLHIWEDEEDQAQGGDQGDWNDSMKGDPQDGGWSKRQSEANDTASLAAPSESATQSSSTVSDTDIASATLNATTTTSSGSITYTNSAASPSSTPDVNTTSTLSNGSTRGPLPAKLGSFTTKWLHEPRWTVSVDVTNTGPLNGCEIPQLYLSFPPDAGEPPKVLRDFARINLWPEETQTVTFELSRYDVSIWDVVKQKWAIPKGEFGVEVGRSSMDENSVRTQWCFRGC